MQNNPQRPLSFDDEPPKGQNRKSTNVNAKVNNFENPMGSAIALLREASKQVKTDDRSSPDDIIIVVMGPTGSGKSSFINIITGFQAGVGRNLEPSSSKISTVRLSIPEIAFGDLVFVNTPGFDGSQDTHKFEEGTLKLVAEWLRLTYEENILLSGLLYFHRISDNGMASTPLRNPRMFEGLFGQNASQSVILTTTMWDKVDEELGEAREKVLKGRYWRHMLDDSSMMSRFMRTRESAFTAIDPLIDAANKRSSRLLQGEMMNTRRNLPWASAGRKLASDMEGLVRQREALLCRIRNEMKRADGDKMTSKESLQQQHRKLQVELETTINEMQKLRLPLGDRLLNMTDKFIRSNFEGKISNMRLHTPNQLPKFTKDGPEPIVSEVKISNMRLHTPNQVQNDSEVGPEPTVSQPINKKENLKGKNVPLSLGATEDAQDALPKETGHHPIPVAVLHPAQELQRPCDLDIRNQWPNDSKGGPESAGFKSKTDHSPLLRTTVEDAQRKAGIFFPAATVQDIIPAAGLPVPQKVETQLDQFRNDSKGGPKPTGFDSEAAHSEHAQDKSGVIPKETVHQPAAAPQALELPCDLETEPTQWPNNSEDGPRPTRSESQSVQSSLSEETVRPIPAADLAAPQKLETQAFHSTLLPNFRVPVSHALTTFETRISPWLHPAEWLDANTKHISSIFDGIVNFTANTAIKVPATKISQRLIAYMCAYNTLCSSDKTLSEKLNATLKKYQTWDILNLMRSQGKIRDELIDLFRKVSPKHREKQFEDLLQKLLVLDSIALSANVEAIVANKETYEDLVEATGAGAQSLVNLLHARLDFPMDPKHKRLLVQAVTSLSETSGLYPESLTLNNVTPEHGRRASGGFADVYKGICFDEDIAIKVFKMPLPSNVNSLSTWGTIRNQFQNLLREFITWRQLSHPNVLPFYGVHFLKDTLETRFCLVSPWMENGNVVEFLARRHRKDPFNDTTNCVCLALDIALGVQYLHGEKVIHRDLKGYNILIAPTLRACIADFGLATLTDSGSATTLAGNAIMGTPKWLAPELIPHPEVKRHHTYASDIYAFALVCYELFSGQVPFENIQLYDVQFLLEKGERPSLPTDGLSRRRGLSPEMEDVIRVCWSQEPSKRLSADELVARLQVLQPVDERPPNRTGTSFFTRLLREQVDNPFTILYSEQHGLGGGPTGISGSSFSQ